MILCRKYLSQIWMKKKIRKWPITVFSQEVYIDKMSQKIKVKHLKNLIKIQSSRYLISHRYKLSEHLGNKQWMMLFELDFHRWSKKKRQSKERWLLMRENINEIRQFKIKILCLLSWKRFIRYTKKKIRMRRL